MLAQRLSAVKTFYTWLAEREGFDPSAVLAARAEIRPQTAPTSGRRRSRRLIDRVEVQVEPGAARDTAVVTLLYGCGLRISEALSLTGADAPLPTL